jgi:hypothetical protein
MFKHSEGRLILGTAKFLGKKLGYLMKLPKSKMRIGRFPKAVLFRETSLCISRFVA